MDGLLRNPRARRRAFPQRRDRAFSAPCIAAAWGYIMFSNTLRALLLASALAAAPLAAMAQVVAEAGDAGQLLGTAQITSGYVTTINGYLGNLGNTDFFVPDTDLYRITITNPGAFSVAATTNDAMVDLVGDTFPHDDTELFLFDSGGILVGYSDDDPVAGFTPMFDAGDFAGLAAGNYFLGFNLFSFHPTFADGAFAYGPTGGLEGPLTGWAGHSQSRVGAYTLSLTGVGSRGALPDGPDGAVPEPSAWALMIMGFGTVGAALRRRNRATDAYSRRSAVLPA
jgi:hypothetical protein